MSSVFGLMARLVDTCPVSESAPFFKCLTGCRGVDAHRRSEAKVSGSGSMLMASEIFPEKCLYEFKATFNWISSGLTQISWSCDLRRGLNMYFPSFWTLPGVSFSSSRAYMSLCFCGNPKFPQNLFWLFFQFSYDLYSWLSTDMWLSFDLLRIFCLYSLSW